MKKQIKVTSTVIKELNGVDIAKYLISIGVYKENSKETVLKKGEKE